MTTKQIIVEVGLPDPCLNPNNITKTHWAKVRACKKSLREAVVNTIRITQPKLIGLRWKRASIKYDFYHSVNRTRDDDNFRAMMKSARDAFGPEHTTKKGNIVAGVGIVGDDTHITDSEPVGFHIDKNHQRVRITLTRTA